jgi:hypothetical protein
LSGNGNTPKELLVSIKGFDYHVCIHCILKSYNRAKDILIVRATNWSSKMQCRMAHKSYPKEDKDHDFLFCQSPYYFSSHMADLVVVQVKQIFYLKSSIFQLTKEILWGLKDWSLLEASYWIWWSRSQMGNDKSWVFMSWFLECLKHMDWDSFLRHCSDDRENTTTQTHRILRNEMYRVLWGRQKKECKICQKIPSTSL